MRVKWNGTRTLKYSTLLQPNKGMMEMLSPQYNSEKFMLREEAIPVPLKVLCLTDVTNFLGVPERPAITHVYVATIR